MDVPDQSYTLEGATPDWLLLFGPWVLMPRPSSLMSVVKIVGEHLQETSLLVIAPAPTGRC